MWIKLFFVLKKAGPIWIRLPAWSKIAFYSKLFYFLPHYKHLMRAFQAFCVMNNIFRLRCHQLCTCMCWYPLSSSLFRGWMHKVHSAVMARTWAFWPDHFAQQEHKRKQFICIPGNPVQAMRLQAPRFNLCDSWNHK